MLLICKSQFNINSLCSLMKIQICESKNVIIAGVHVSMIGTYSRIPDINPVAMVIMTL
jgi:hypothetical protein